MSNELFNYHIKDGYPCGNDATLSEIADYYGEVLSNLPRWISVEERLLEDDRDVLILSAREEQYAKMFWQYWGKRWPSSTCNKKTLQLSANFRETKAAFFAGMHAALKVMED